jgi:hypothetical protein
MNKDKDDEGIELKEFLIHRNSQRRNTLRKDSAVVRQRKLTIKESGPLNMRNSSRLSKSGSMGDLQEGATPRARDYVPHKIK